MTFFLECIHSSTLFLCFSMSSPVSLPAFLSSSQMVSTSTYLAQHPYHGPRCYVSLLCVCVCVYTCVQVSWFRSHIKTSTSEFAGKCLNTSLRGSFLSNPRHILRPQHETKEIIKRNCLNPGTMNLWRTADGLYDMQQTREQTDYFVGRAVGRLTGVSC